MEVSKFYGIVEGFFSDPLPLWNEKERLNTLRFICQNAQNINTFFYCPKDDPYILKSWSKPYPTPKILNLQKTISFCKKNSLNFIYGLNPPLTLAMNFQKKEKWLKRVINKFSQLISVDCYNFCLLFDDIPFAEVGDDPLTLSGESLGQTLVNLINNLYTILRPKIKEFWLCAPDYCYREKTPFTNQLQNLNPKIPLIWTGNDVFVKNISRRDFQRIRKILSPKRKIIWWSNYPVNDCEQNLGTFNLGGFYAPKKKVVKELYGIIVNPMRECYANLPFYLTFSDYIDNPKSYNRTKSWQRALKQLIGDCSKSYELIFQEFSARNLVDSQPKYLYKKLYKAGTITKTKMLVKQASQELNLVEKSPLKTLWGKLFVKSIFPILNDARALLSFVNKILFKQKIDEGDFARWDWFPTTTTLPRYYPEIFEIIKIRLSLLPKCFRNLYKEKLSRLCRINNEFQRQYKGKKKLEITKTDSLKFRRAINGGVSLERDLLLELLNSGKIKPVQKIQLFSVRQNINRFTTPKADKK